MKLGPILSFPLNLFKISCPGHETDPEGLYNRKSKGTGVCYIPLTATMHKGVSHLSLMLGCIIYKAISRKKASI